MPNARDLNVRKVVLLTPRLAERLRELVEVTGAKSEAEALRRAIHEAHVRHVRRDLWAGEPGPIAKTATDIARSFATGVRGSVRAKSGEGEGP